MGSLWFFCKKLALVSTLFLASASWHSEVQAQPASLRLSWTDNSGNEDGFKIERLVGGVIDTTLAVSANVTSYIDSVLVAGTVYCYQVKAFNSAGDSNPSNQSCASAQAATISVSPTSIAPKGTVTATWSGGVGDTSDWIGLYTPGAADANYIDWIYTTCSQTPGSGRSSGSCSYVLPATVSAGTYNLRLFTDSLTKLATSNTFTVTTSTSSSIASTTQIPSLAVSPTSVAAKGTITATWSNAVGDTSDWIGLYTPGAADANYIDWIYTTCSQTPGSGRSSGSCSYVLPATVSAGTYNLRLFTDSLTKLATSNTFTVTTSTSSSIASTTQIPSLAVSPTSVAAKGTITATWSNAVGDTSDWIGLYTPGAADANYIDWIYTTCSQTPGSGRSSGSCSYVLPATVSAGTYNLRLFTDSLTKLATSNTFTVTTSTSSSIASTTQIPSLAVSPTSVAAKGTITATWSNAVGDTSDWIGLYTPGAADANYIDWIYTTCSQTPGSGRSSGSCSYVLPATVSAGTYNLRLFTDSLTKLATSNTFTVTTSTSSSIASTTQIPSLAVSPTSVAAKGTITATWSNAAGDTSDWIGLYTPGAADANYIDWIYTTCSQTPGSGRSSGSCSYVLPATVSAGTYNLRLFTDSLTKLATSNTFTVTTSTSSSIASTTQIPSLAVSPTSVAAKGTITATWSNAAGDTSDWIGLYTPGAADANYIDWIYTTCSQTPGSGRSSGSCSYVLPATVSAGTYNLRLFTDSLTKLATSNTFTVTTSTSSSIASTTQIPSLAVSPTSVAAKGTITATWSNAVGDTSDWIGLYTPGAADANYIDWIYTTCSQTPGSGRSSGSCSYVLPATVSAGTYNLRLFTDSLTKLATSNTFTVSIPTNTAVQTLTGSLRLTWTDTSNNEDGFKVERLVAGLVDAMLTVPANAISYIDSALTAGTVYCYRVAAFNSAGDSDSSNQSCATAQDPIVGTASPAPTPSVSPTSSTFPVSTSSTSTPVVLANAVNTANGSTTQPQISRKWTDYDLKVKLQSIDNGSIGVMFRYQDNNNFYRFLWNRKSNSRRLEKMQNGTLSQLAKDSVAYAKGQTYQLEIIAQGASLKVLIDGTQIFSATDSTFAEGTIGLYSSGNQGSSFDDVLIQDLATGTTLLSNNFDDGAFIGWTIVDQNTRQAISAWSAASHALLQTSNSNATFALYTARNFTDYRFSVALRSTDNDSIGVMFRYLDNNNYYRFAWNNNNRFRRLEKVVNGVLTVLAEDAIPYVTKQTYKLEITAQSTMIEVRVDDKLVFSVADSSFDKGTVALYSWYNKGSSFNDVLVQDLATETVLLSDDFNNGNFTRWTIVDKGTDAAPSSWSAASGSLVQGSNIGSTTSFDGTFALY